MVDKNKYIGTSYVNKDGCEFKVIEYKSFKEVTIVFSDGFKRTVYMNAVLAGEVKNPMHPTILNNGYMGVGMYKSRVKGVVTKSYKVWESMIHRCYDPIFLQKRSTYRGCSIQPKWLNFQVFAKWFEDNYKEGYALDKDLLLKGNKMYSEDTCCFIPQCINSLLVKRDYSRGLLPIGVWKPKGCKRFASNLSISNKKVHLGYFDTPELAFQAYKEAKEAHIKVIAEKYKDSITEQVYHALLNYKVEIID